MSGDVALKRQNASRNLLPAAAAPAPAPADQLQDPLVRTAAVAAQPAPVAAAAPAQAKPAASTLTLTQAYNDYPDALSKFAKEAFCDESIEFLRSVDAGRDPKTMYNRFIKQGASRQVNIPNAVREPLDGQAAKNQYDRMDFSIARANIWAMLENDIVGRMRTSKVMQAAVGG